ncbi:histidine kinase2 isoform X1, putative [Babesia ovata]|uniref:Histidine kinase2 isoform X1, putative n=1 Tax=Babesia ovata TaxID=189622 RepID=A0A2H6KEE1_9APIC|nr:histidine kinase2 isoform X1, putative [Babesia ovata]GBE61370.1 histidine kinase2 isoform X1, putative [Babesia ovata]
MKCILSLTLLAISQIGHILAAGQQQVEASQSQNVAASDAKEIKYAEIIPNAEKRVKIIMGLMERDGFKTELLTSLHGEISKASNQLFAKWSKVLGEEYQKRFESTTLKTTLPSWLLADKVKASSDQADAVRNALTEAGKSIHKLLTYLFDDYAEKIKPKAEKAQAAQTAGSVGVSAEESQMQESAQETTDGNLLNLRFVLPSVADDLSALYDSIKKMPTTNEEEKKAILAIVTKWLKDNIPNIEAKASLDAVQIKDEMSKLFDTQVHLRDSVIAINAYNQLDAKLSESVEKCKKMNSASFGAVSLLLAAVLAFTMW